MTRINNDERARTFGPPCTPANHRLYVTPWGIRVQVHKLIAPRFSAACVVAHRESRWRPQRIDGYNCRTIRGSASYSIHAWAMSWDFFATPPNVPPPGGVWTPDNPPDAKFIAAFTELGFTWGGTFKRKDTPHIEWASAPPSGVEQQPPPTTPTNPTEYPEDNMRGTPKKIPLGDDGTGWIEVAAPAAKIFSITVNGMDIAGKSDTGRAIVCDHLAWGTGSRVVARASKPGKGLIDVVVWEVTG